MVVLSISGPGASLNSLLFVVGPLAAPYFIVKFAIRTGVLAASKTAAAPEVRTARKVLDEGYASGEIGQEEYGRVRRDLETP